MTVLDFKPKNPDYEALLAGINGIFARDGYKAIPIATRIEAADALGLAGDMRYERIEWVKMPGGRFWMGAQKQNQFYHNFDLEANKLINECAVHQVELSPF